MKSIMRRRTKAGLAAMCLVGALGAAAQAMPVIMTFDGPLTHVDSSVADRFGVGDLMHVSITFESTTPDGVPELSYVGYYYPAVTAFSLSVAGYSATATNGYFTIYNDHGADIMDDSFEMSAEAFDSPGMRVGTLVGDPVNGMDLWWFRLGLFDDTATALDSDALPTSIDVSDFGYYPQMALQWRHISDHGTFNEGISVRSFTSTSTFPTVPVPGAMALAALGAGAVGWIRRRRGA